MSIKPLIKNISKHTFNLFVLLVAGIYTRCLLNASTDSMHVIWDEGHFGKYAALYLKGMFHLDVHPPGGKILLATVGAYYGFNGTYEFNSQPIPSDVPVLQMRQFTGFLSALTLPMMYGIGINVGLNKITAFTAGIMLLAETSTITITRYFLLDSPLLFSTTWTLFCHSSFIKVSLSNKSNNDIHSSNDSHTPYFSFWWFFWLLLTGISIGITLSIKWVGLFTMSVVGFHTGLDLWKLLDRNITISKIRWSFHFIFRFIFLVLVPFGIYVCFFVLHFHMLKKQRDEVSAFSPHYQASSFESSTLRENIEYVAYGSDLRLAVVSYPSMYLHSHVARYPKGSKQQQITGVGNHGDVNNNWIIIPVNQTWVPLTVPRIIVGNSDNYYALNLEQLYNPKLSYTEQLKYVFSPICSWYFHELQQMSIQYIEDGSLIRLLHKSTSCFLHSHQTRSEVLNSQQEVSCYGAHRPIWFDSNDIWRVIIASKTTLLTKRITSLLTEFMVSTNLTIRDANTTLDSEKQLSSLYDTFLLQHVETGCYLRISPNRDLPEWGYGQRYIYCDRTKRIDEHSTWAVHLHRNDLIAHTMPSAKASKFQKMSFWNMFFELNKAMYRTNKAMIMDIDKDDPLQSHPLTWPLLNQQGIRMTQWNEDSQRVYLIGNLAVYISIFIAIIQHPLLLFCGLLLMQRRCEHHWLLNRKLWLSYRLFFGGWCFHYFPFFIIGRVTYLHHYIPCIPFGILSFVTLLEVYLDAIFNSTSQRIQKQSKLLHFMSKVIEKLIYILLCVLFLTVYHIFLHCSTGMTGSFENYKHLKWIDSWTVV